MKNQEKFAISDVRESLSKNCHLDINLKDGWQYCNEIVNKVDAFKSAFARIATMTSNEKPQTALPIVPLAGNVIIRINTQLSPTTIIGGNFNFENVNGINIVAFGQGVKNFIIGDSVTVLFPFDETALGRMISVDGNSKDFFTINRMLTGITSSEVQIIRNEFPLIQVIIYMRINQFDISHIMFK